MVNFENLVKSAHIERYDTVKAFALTLDTTHDARPTAERHDCDVFLRRPPE
jgi:hypothetical protein